MNSGDPWGIRVLRYFGKVPYLVLIPAVVLAVMGPSIGDIDGYWRPVTDKADIIAVQPLAGGVGYGISFSLVPKRDCVRHGFKAFWTDSDGERGPILVKETRMSDPYKVALALLTQVPPDRWTIQVQHKCYPWVPLTSTSIYP